jgi:hypothetical protein
LSVSLMFGPYVPPAAKKDVNVLSNPERCAKNESHITEMRVHCQENMSEIGIYCERNFEPICRADNAAEGFESR